MITVFKNIINRLKKTMKYLVKALPIILPLAIFLFVLLYVHGYFSDQINCQSTDVTISFRFNMAGISVASNSHNPDVNFEFDIDKEEKKIKELGMAKYAEQYLLAFTSTYGGKCEYIKNAY